MTPHTFNNAETHSMNCDAENRKVCNSTKKTSMQESKKKLGSLPAHNQYWSSQHL